MIGSIFEPLNAGFVIGRRSGSRCAKSAAVVAKMVSSFISCYLLLLAYCFQPFPSVSSSLPVLVFPPPCLGCLPGAFLARLWIKHSNALWEGRRPRHWRAWNESGNAILISSMTDRINIPPAPPRRAPRRRRDGHTCTRRVRQVARKVLRQIILKVTRQRRLVPFLLY